MLTPDELAILESLCSRARGARDAGAAGVATGDPETIAPGDVVQLRPGADYHWKTSLFLVCKVRDDGGISGQILRPHRGGYMEAYYTFRPPAVVKIGRAPFAEPPLSVRSAGYLEPCPYCHDARRKPPRSEKKFT